jgi:hypothetical protein
MMQEKGAQAEPTTTGGFDINTMSRAFSAPLIVWAAAVGLVTFSGYPGVVCMTPMAWLLGTWVGTFVAGRSRSPAARRLQEAAICGALLGLAQGLIFYLVQLGMPLQPGEEQKALTLTLGIAGFGTLVSALLSLWTAAMRNRRRGLS